MSEHHLRVQVASFNAGQHLEENALPDFTSWLIPTVQQDPSSGYAVAEKTASRHPQAFALGPRDAPDVYAVGFQEFALLPHGLAGFTESMRTAIDREIRRTVRLHQATVRPDRMYDPLELGGGPENYARIAEIVHGGMVLFVYARERPSREAANLPSAAERVKEVRMATVGTGIFNLMGNKGAVGARVTLAPLHAGGEDEVLTFVCAHLAAHDHNVERRNRDWQNIVQRLVFSPDDLGYVPNVVPSTMPGDVKETMGQIHSVPTKPASQHRTKALDSNEYSVYDTHHLFVLGDLNYRIGTGVPGAPPSGGPVSRNTYPPMKRSDVKMLAQSKNPKRWAWLLPYDQLALQHAVSPPRAFQSLYIPDLSVYNLPPTYKYKVPKTPADTQDVLSKKRVPGWPDRILWSEPQSVGCELYRSLMEYRVSDHKPITAILTVPSTRARTFLAAPYPIDPAWRTMQFRGRWLDRIIGYLWSLLLLFGNGSLPLAAIEVALLAILGAWWVSGHPIPLIRPNGAAI
ncbi:hypothetical protein GLX27_000625 [Malassezia furfur]|uniref:Inositol polyphosphate-related phosphatase domain-containing protein n=1 Tax=Malassezia furfur TaxID=55194 RepID=A0ABY8EK21_MALFU|nr:hypothetical protein CBS14141_001697 [Malassezia furfur]WFD45997.1 hypothetical protein GLX27_000625 [Malassezia furfur]